MGQCCECRAAFEQLRRMDMAWTCPVHGTQRVSLSPLVFSPHDSDGLDRFTRSAEICRPGESAADAVQRIRDENEAAARVGEWTIGEELRMLREFAWESVHQAAAEGRLHQMPICIRYWSTLYDPAQDAGAWTSEEPEDEAE